MTDRDRKLFIALAVLIVVLSLFADAVDDGDSRDHRPSSYVTSEVGAAALYLTLEELSIPVTRLLTPLDAGEWSADVLVLLAPSQAPTPSELGALADWIRGGGTLLYAAHPGDPVLDTLGLAVRSPVSVPGGARTRGVDGNPTVHPVTSGSSSAGPFRWVFEVDDAGTVDPLLETSEGEPVALQAGFGHGQIIAFSDSRPLLNGEIEESRAAPIFVHALVSAGERIAFDEYHHGFREDGNVVGATLRFVTRTAPGRASLQLGVAALGLLLLAGARFGAPLPAPPAQRRSPLEHVDALAQAYEQANARRSARRLILAGLLRRLGRPHREGDGERTFDTMRRGAPARVREHVDALEAEWKRGESADLVALTRHMDAIVKESRSA